MGRPPKSIDKDKIIDQSLEVGDPKSLYNNAATIQLLRMFAASESVPEWWSPQRDEFLRDLITNGENDLLASAFSGMVKKMASMPFIVTGPKGLTRYFHKALIGMEGWSFYFRKEVQNFLGTDKGAVTFIIADGEERPPKFRDGKWEAGVKGPVKGLPYGLESLDSKFCNLTGNPDWPIVYESEKGPFLLHRSRVIRAVDLLTPRRDKPQVGFCSVSRSLRAVRTLSSLHRLHEEQLNDLPPAGLLLFNNINLRDWQDQLEAYKIGQEQQGNSIFRDLMVLFGLDPERPADARFVNFSVQPENFGLRDAYDLVVLVLALSFGVDPREFWAISSGALGTSTETEIQHIKAQLKGPADILRTYERLINLKFTRSHETGVVFRFDSLDLEQRRLELEGQDAFTKIITRLYQATDGLGISLLTRGEARKLLADNKIIPKEFLGDEIDELELGLTTYSDDVVSLRSDYGEQ